MVKWLRVDLLGNTVLSKRKDSNIQDLLKYEGHYQNQSGSYGGRDSVYKKQSYTCGGCGYNPATILRITDYTNQPRYNSYPFATNSSQKKYPVVYRSETCDYCR